MSEDPNRFPFTGWLGVGATWRGDLQFSGRVRVDGTVIGTITSEDLLDVGAAGRVDGEIRVAQALIGGVVNGTLIATERVTLLESAVVTGEVHAPFLDVRNGARIDARVTVRRD